MEKYYFESPIGVVLCEICEERIITKCHPISEVDGQALVKSKEKHPQLALAFSSLSPCPNEYKVIGGKTPSFAPYFWDFLAKVPFGTQLTYGQFAEKLGLSKGYARVVGNVLGSNECFVLLPCHRIVKANGDVGGFKWGSDLKKKLLEYESVIQEKLPAF